MTFNNPKQINQRYNHEGNRIWKIEEDDNRKIVGKFFRLCSSKLTINDIESFGRDKIQKVINNLIGGKITLEDLSLKNSDELYDYIIEQKRLF